MDLGNFSAAQSFIIRAKSTPEIPDKDIVLAKLQCAQGLVDLSCGKFQSAANYFLETTFQLEGKYSEVRVFIYCCYLYIVKIKAISPNDIATYGGLCALSTFTRAELKKKVFENSEFKQFLELEPEIGELMHCFYHSKYSKCLEILERKKVCYNLYPFLNFNLGRSFVRYLSPSTC